MSTRIMPTSRKGKRSQCYLFCLFRRSNHVRSLYPMLENGLITFDLLWALWKPNTLAFTTTYGSHDEPRVFKVEMAEKHFSIMKGEYYYIEGKVWHLRWCLRGLRIVC